MKKEVNVSFLSSPPWLLLCWRQYLYLCRPGGSSFYIPVWHFHLSKGSQYFFYHNILSLFISWKQTWLQMKGNIALRLLDLPKVSLCLAVFFLSMCPFTFLVIRSRCIGNFYKHEPHVHSFQLAGWRRDGCWRWDGSEKGSCLASQILRWFLKSAFRKSIVLQYMQW